MIGLIGKKIGMTQIFDDKGRSVPVTVIQAGPCRVVQKKSEEDDGYNAVQLGFEEVAEKKISKSMIGHFKKHKSPFYKYLKEFRLKMYIDIEEGEEFDVSMFVKHEILEVSGVSKGKGFAGVMKRHGFHGFKASHGVHESFRGPGAIGQCATPARVHKGKKMPGHKGVDKVSILNAEVMKVDKSKNLVLVKGAIPGHRNSILRLRKEL